MLNLSVNYKALEKSAKGVRLANLFKLTKITIENGLSKFQAGVVAIENGWVYTSFLAKIQFCVDMGDYYRVTYIPENKAFGKSGVTHVYKDGRTENGVLVGLERTFIDTNTVQDTLY